MSVGEAVVIWLATEVVAPDLFARAIDALRSDDEIRRLMSAVREDAGFDPGGGYRRWLESDDTWADLVDRTDEAYRRLIASLAIERSRRRFLRDRAVDEGTAVRLVDATLGHFVASLRPSNAIAVVGQRLDTRLDTVVDHLHQISKRLDESTKLESRLSQLPPPVRRILATTEHRSYAERLLRVVVTEDRRGAVEGLVRVNPPWLQNAPPVIQLAVGELCESYGLDAEAEHFFVAAADGGLDRAFLYARAARAAVLGGDAARSQELFEHARKVGGGGAVEMMAAGLAADPAGILASMPESEALEHPLLTILYGTALRTSGESQRAISFLTTAVARWPDFSGPALELAWVLLGRAQSTATTSRSADRARAIELALRVREQRREWGGDASEAVHVACLAAMTGSDFGLAVRLGALPPDGEALPTEADHPDVRYAVFQASLALGNVDRARAIAESTSDGFQAALLSAEILTATSAHRDAIAQEFQRVWPLAKRDEDRAAVWFAASEAGIEPLPGQSELDARTDEIPILVYSQADMANGRFAEAATRLRSRPASESCARMLSHALAKGGRLDEAIMELEAAGNRFDNPDHLYAAARLLIEADRINDAVDIADRALIRLPASLADQRAFCHQVGISAAHDRGAWGDMATRVRAWINDQGETPGRRWLLVQALQNQGAFDEAWAVMRDEPALEPANPFTAQLWIVLSARFRPGPDLAVEILDIHDRFAAADSNVTRAAVNAFVNMGEAKGEIDPAALARYHALMERREAIATASSDDTFFSLNVPDTVEEFVETFRPHLEPRAQQMERVAERVAFGGPYGLLSAAAGLSYTAALVQRGAGCLPIEGRDSARLSAELAAARSAIDGPAAIDLSTVCCAWYLLDLWPQIRSGVTRIEAPSPARDDVVRALDSLTPRPAGYLSWDTHTGRPVMTDADPVELERIEAHIAWVAEAISQVTVRDWPSLVTDDFASHNDARLLPWLAAVDLAKQSGLPLWADDVGLRSLARDVGVPSFGSVALLTALEEHGRLSPVQRRTAMRVFRDEYCVDLELDVEWMQSSAAAAEWRAGPAMVNFARPAVWADIEAAFSVWREIVQAASNADSKLIGPWIHAAATGICRGVPPDRCSAVVASLVCRGLLAGDFESSVFTDCLNAGRQACKKAGAEDPLAATVKLLLDLLGEHLGPAAAAKLVSTFASDLEEEDRAQVSQLVFGVELA